MRTAAESGVGIAILTQRVLSPAPKRSPVVFVPLADTDIQPQLIACCTRTGRALSAASLAMIGEFEMAYTAQR